VLRQAQHEVFLNAMKILPHPEPVEGRTAFVQQLNID
jgi:hypothetical protein